MVEVARSENNPLIQPTEAIGDIINSPSIIQVPSWVDDPIGNYYLYFSHKHGKYIRMAYADEIEGPWEIYSPGVLHIEDTPFTGHIASPDVHVDHSEKVIRLYYHGESTLRDLIFGPLKHRTYRKQQYGYRYRSIPHRVLYQTGRWTFAQLQGGEIEEGATASPTVAGSNTESSIKSSLIRRFTKPPLKPKTVQETRQASSRDGLSFDNSSPILGPSWFAVWEHRDRYYGLGSRAGYLYTSGSPTEPFDRIHNLFDRGQHFGVDVSGDELDVYYSDMKGQTERIYRTTIELAPSVSDWIAREPIEIIAPETRYETADFEDNSARENDYPTRRSEVRDPEIFAEDGTKYLFYAAGGETGISMAKLIE